MNSDEVDNRLQILLSHARDPGRTPLVYYSTVREVAEIAPRAVKRFLGKSRELDGWIAMQLDFVDAAKEVVLAKATSSTLRLSGTAASEWAWENCMSTIGDVQRIHEYLKADEAVDAIRRHVEASQRNKLADDAWRSLKDDFLRVISQEQSSDRAWEAFEPLARAARKEHEGRAKYSFAQWSSMVYSVRLDMETMASTPSSE